MKGHEGHVLRVKFSDFHRVGTGSGPASPGSGTGSAFLGRNRPCFGWWGPKSALAGSAGSAFAADYYLRLRKKKVGTPCAQQWETQCIGQPQNVTLPTLSHGTEANWHNRIHEKEK